MRSFSQSKQNRSIALAATISDTTTGPHCDAAPAPATLDAPEETGPINEETPPHRHGKQYGGDHRTVEQRQAPGLLTPLYPTVRSPCTLATAADVRMKLTGRKHACHCGQGPAPGLSPDVVRPGLRRDDSPRIVRTTHDRPGDRAGTGESPPFVLHMPGYQPSRLIHKPVIPNLCVRRATCRTADCD